MTLHETWNDDSAAPPALDDGHSTRIGLAPPPPDSSRRRPAPLLKLGPGVQLPGTRYRIMGWLGDGATGVVYRAEHVDLERFVALKILRPEITGSARIAEMLRREAKNVGRLSSEFIVEVHDLGELPDGRVWFAMPLLDGRSLDAVLGTAPMEPARVLGIVRQVCKALTAAHEKDIIHRDVKPANIMLVKVRGRDDAVRMLDWGIAVRRDDAAKATGSTAGTPYYIAPELVSRVAYDHRVDIYSLGCTAFQMLAGRPPFVAPDMASVLVAHVDQPAPLLRTFAPAVPAALEKVIARCLAKDPSARYADAADLEAAWCEAQIEAKLESAWDDLPLPEVAAERRAALISGMPDRTFRAERRWLVPALLGAGIASVVALTAATYFRGPDLAATTDVDRLTEAARAAAARSFFLYPPLDAPRSDTAYSVVLQLEDLRGSAADAGDARALALRREFADTLVRLGDKYWARQGGRPFSIDYYAEALMFVPDHERARARASLTPGELSELRSKAGAQTFTDPELRAAQPLVALAETDPEARATQLRALASVEAVGASTAQRLDQLVDNDPEAPAATQRTASTKRPQPVVQATPAPDAADASGVAPTDDAPAQPEQPTASDPELRAPVAKLRDRDAAKERTDRALAAFARGALDEARREFQRAVAADDRYSPAHHGLSRLEFHRGNYASAARHGERAVAIWPKNAKYRLDLGDAYYKAYRYSDAAQAYEAAKRLGHDAADARLAKVANQRGG